MAYITDATGQRLYTTDEAASYLGVHPGHVRKLVQREDLKPIRKGRDLLFSKATLDNYKKIRKPQGRPLKRTRSKGIAEERRKMREYMREYRSRKAEEKAEEDRLKVERNALRRKNRAQSKKVIKFRKPGRK